MVQFSEAHMAKKPNRKWMQQLDIQAGALTEKARKAGMSVAEYSAEVLKPDSSASLKTRRQANLAQVFAHTKHPKKTGK
jgi:hypothetical protein